MNFPCWGRARGGGLGYSSSVRGAGPSRDVFAVPETERLMGESDLAKKIDWYYHRKG